MLLYVIIDDLGTYSCMYDFRVCIYVYTFNIITYFQDHFHKLLI